MQPILYIHGFGSSGHSAKAQTLRAHFPEVYAPSLPPVPRLALETMAEFIAALGERTPLLVGSSLGGYYALHLSASRGLPAVLVNPVVRIEAALERLVGMNRNYFDGARFETTREHLESLARLEPLDADPQRLLLLLQLGDEVLDQRTTIEHLPDARRVVEPGGSHAFDQFERHMETIRRFAADRET